MSAAALRAIALLAAMAPVLAPLAAAHTVADPDAGPAGGSLRTSFRVTHGCKGSPTVALAIRMPAGVISAKPMPKPGWTVEVKTEPLEKPVAGLHGVTIRQAVTEVSWRGGRLENAQFDEFTVLVGLPDRPGETLYFPTVQTCEKGVNEWTGIPAGGQSWHDLPSPAPFVRLLGHDHSHQH